MKNFFPGIVIVFSGHALLAQPAVSSRELPRVSPVEVSKVLQTFQVKPGFHLEIVATEPLVNDPVAMSFDENGRLFVVEMRDYSERRNEHPHLGRIRLLEDSDGDGKFERSTVYAADLPWPTGVICYDGGIFVAATPDILYIKDTDGDGKADTRKVAFTGFGAGKGEKLNVQALVNGLSWGMDNRIHGQTSGNGGVVRNPAKPEIAPVDLQGRDFHFDPKTLDLGTEGGGGQFGISFDNQGRRFFCSNSHHIQTYMYDTRYAGRNPQYNMPNGLVDIAVDGAAAEVYRTSGEESWRVMRTKWRVAGQVPGPVEGGGRASGYFTSATGLTIYRGNAWPREYLGDAFIADCGSNLIHRKKVRTKGAEFFAERPADEQKVEFLTSNDLWFRPVQMANAPDGTLYIADMYREVIEHPWSIPESIKTLLDLNSGNERGRIYRVVPDGFKQPSLPRLGAASVEELVATLDHPNGWHRDTAARLLYERHDRSAIPLLEEKLPKAGRRRDYYPSSTQPPQGFGAIGILHALHTLDRLKGLKESHLIGAFDHPHPAVREHAVKLSERFFVDGKPSPQLFKKLVEMTQTASAPTRYQLAFTLGEMKGASRMAPLVEIARRDGTNAWVRAAILSSLGEGAGEFLQACTEKNLEYFNAGRVLIPELLKLIGTQNRPGDVAMALRVISAKGKYSFVLLRSLGEGLEGAGSSLPTGNTALQEIFTQARNTAAYKKQSLENRIESIRVLALDKESRSSRSLFLAILDSGDPEVLRVEAMAALGRERYNGLADQLLGRWQNFTPRLKNEALSLLLARPERTMVVLEAMVDRRLPVSALHAAQVKFLQSHPNAAVRELSARVFEVSIPRREALDAASPALKLKGDPTRAKVVYMERCFSCHRAGGEGHALGPDLVTMKSAGREKNLLNIVDPNREVRPEYAGYLLQTTDGESHLGLVVNQTSTSVTLRQAYGREEVFPRKNILKLESRGESMMPEGLEQGLSDQNLADLLDFIENAGNPSL